MSEPESLLDLLACPKCHGSLHRTSTPEGFGCAACSLFYAVEDGLPNMLIDDAKAWTRPSADDTGLKHSPR